MCCCEVFDVFFCNRVVDLGIILINGLVQKIDIGIDCQGFYIIYYVDYSGGGFIGEQKILVVDLIIGVDGVNFWVVKVMDVGDYNVVIVFQEWIKFFVEEMIYYEDFVEMYVGIDVFFDFYVWVFFKYDYVVVGIGIMQQNQSLIKGL